MDASTYTNAQHIQEIIEDYLKMPNTTFGIADYPDK